MVERKANMISTIYEAAYQVKVYKEIFVDTDGTAYGLLGSISIFLDNSIS